METSSFFLYSLLALALGAVIGLERQFRLHPAGLRTNSLVCCGASLFVSVSLLAYDTNSPTRVASYVVSGIGFLGGGVILREGFNVRGIETAATLWCSAAVGVLSGMGFPLEASIGAALVLGINLGVRPIARRIEAWASASDGGETTYRLQIIAPGSNGAASGTSSAAGWRSAPDGRCVPSGWAIPSGGPRPSSTLRLRSPSGTTRPSRASKRTSKYGRGFWPGLGGGGAHERMSFVYWHKNSATRPKDRTIRCVPRHTRSAYGTPDDTAMLDNEIVDQLIGLSCVVIALLTCGSVVQRAVKKFGKIDVLVNNAATK